MTFYKYHGSGNDFVIIDQRAHQYLTGLDQLLIEQMCDRRYGIGADGLMCIEDSDEYDFRMVYYNADGRESTMCGNGGRCIVSLAYRLGVFFGNTCNFIAKDGKHEAIILEDGRVSLEMQDVNNVERYHEDYILDTGSPHYVCYRDDLEKIDVEKEGKAIRNSRRFKEDGINVNFVSINKEYINVRTFERGVEGETHACGTGVTAVALVDSIERGYDGTHHQKIQTQGGLLEVKFHRMNGAFTNIHLIGPAVAVFEGSWPKSQVTNH